MKYEKKSIILQGEFVGNDAGIYLIYDKKKYQCLLNLIRLFSQSGLKKLLGYWLVINVSACRCAFWLNGPNMSNKEYHIWENDHNCDLLRNTAF